MRKYPISPSIAGAALALVMLAAVPAAAQKYGPGVSDGEIKIGTIGPYSGPAAVYGLIGKTMGPYFDMINAQGGVNGRKITLIQADDSFSPQKTVEQARHLVEEDQVLAIVSPIGAAQNLAIRDYMNAKGVPQLFVASGSPAWDNPGKFPWTMGMIPSYRTEGRIYGQYIVESEPQSKVAILYQTGYGKDAAEGLKEGLAGKVPVPGNTDCG
jgi:branched-chain amino acid transport system substrate-binding protein